MVELHPIHMKNAVLTVESDDFSDSVGEVTFVPSASTVPLLGWNGVPFAHSVASVMWVVTLAFAQDIQSGSLSRLAMDHYGETREVVFTPVAGGVSITASVMLLPGALGGLPGQTLSATVTLPVVGEPTVVEP